MSLWAQRCSPAGQFAGAPLTLEVCPMADTPIPIKSVASSALADIAKQLNAEYTAVVAGGIILRAIEFGHRLKQAQAQVGYGLWGSWVKANCNFVERHALRFMTLAANKDKLPLKDQTRMSELTLNEAFRLVAGEAVKKVQEPHKVCDRATKAQLENLWRLDPPSLAEHKCPAIAQGVGRNREHRHSL
jgi:hypothetical protein